MVYKAKRIALAAAAFVLLTALDQWTKGLAVERLKGREAFIIWNHVFELLYSENRGAAFGMMQGGRPFFVVIAVVVFAVVLHVLWRLPDKAKFIPLGSCAVFVAAGAAGNLIDRLANGYVVDFLYFSLIDFPIFNVADCYVTVSAAVLCLLLFSGFYSEEDLDFLRPGRRKLK